MSWLPDSGWLRALDLKASTFAAVAPRNVGPSLPAEFGFLYQRTPDVGSRGVRHHLAAGVYPFGLLGSGIWAEIASQCGGGNTRP
jgi:hypothetical protein